MKTLAEPKENIVEKSKETTIEKPKEKLVNSKEKWKQAKDYSQENDNVTDNFGEKPSPE